MVSIRFLTLTRCVFFPSSLKYPLTLYARQQAVLANEFHNLNLTCSPSDIVPSGPSYTNPLFQTCALPGSVPGSLSVSGDRYLSLTYDFHYSHLWRNLAILGVQAVVFLVIGVVATELLHFAPGGTTRLWKATRAVKRKFAVAKRRAEGGKREASTASGGGSRSRSRERDEEGSLILRRQESAELGYEVEEEGGWDEDEDEEYEEQDVALGGEEAEVPTEDEMTDSEIEGSVLSVRTRLFILSSHPY
jgi:ATP-binding cassette subfamily G (WHITE) protein 2 (SNQ2)